MQIKLKKLGLYKFLLWVSIVFACLFSANIFAGDNKIPLPTEEAFVFSTSTKSATEILAQWKIAPGYYLYRQRFHFSTSPLTDIEVLYPSPEIRKDHNKPFEAYTGNLVIPVVFKSNHPQVQLIIDYQGCSERGFCYPPVHKSITLNFNNPEPTQMIPATGNKESSSFKSLITDQNGVQTILHSQNLGMMLLFFAGLGLLLAFTPCVLPMIPILTSIIVGQNGATTNTKKAFLLSFTYVMGSAIAFALAGVAAAAMGNSIQVWLQKPVIIFSVSALFVLLALSLFGFYDLRLPNRLHNHLTGLSNKQEGGTYFGVFSMGILSTLIVSPCVTAPLVGVLIYIGQTGNLWFGAAALFAMGIGMGIPLLLIGVSAGKWLPKRGPWMEAVKMTFGLIMIAMAIWMLSRILSPNLILVAWGLLFIGIAIFFSIYLPRVVGNSFVNRIVAVAAGLVAILIMAGSIGFSNPVSTWVSPVLSSSEFVVVRSIEDLNKNLFQAQVRRQPVLLDFYADWCESCVAMDRKVFTQSIVQKQLGNYLLLRADLSANTAQDEALLKYFNVIAPPTVLFFDAYGKEIDSQRIVGEVDAKEFLSRLNKS